MVAYCQDRLDHVVLGRVVVAFKLWVRKRCWVIKVLKTCGGSLGHGYYTPEFSCVFPPSALTECLWLWDKGYSGPIFWLVECVYVCLCLLDLSKAWGFNISSWISFPDSHLKHISFSLPIWKPVPFSGPLHRFASCLKNKYILHLTYWLDRNDGHVLSQMHNQT